MNEILTELCRLYNIKRTSTTPYHPQGNAYAERIHQFFRNAVTTFIRGDQLLWDEMLLDLILAYNNSYHEAIGCMPAEAFMGRPGRLPLDVEPVSERKPLSPMQYAEKLNYILGRTEYLICEKLKDKLQKNFKLFQGIKPISFQKGQAVKLYSPKKIVGESAKLAQPFYGPYYVVESTLDGRVYYLQDEEGNMLPNAVSVT